MEVTLTKEQIDHLFDFVRKKYVPYIDIQYEIVDHLASGIEYQMREDDQLSFEQALDNEYGKFPISGFTIWVRDRQNSASKFWIKKFFYEFLNYYRSGNVLFAVLVFILSVMILNMVPYGFYIMVLITIAYASYAIPGMKRHPAYQAAEDKYQEWYIQLYKIQNAGNEGIYVSYFFMMIVMGFTATTYSQLPAVVLGGIFTMQILWIRAAIHHFPEVIISELRRKYDYIELA